MKNILFIALMLFSAFAYSKQCSLTGKITQMHQYTDGTIFINVDASSSCDCAHKSRMAFHRNENQSFYVSAALTALTAKKTVTLTGEDRNTSGACPIHNNSPLLTALYINAD
ncbi:hypothetical protein [Vibrio nigripulchritudo]|uniref:hypothetical protein n=1 Tax=Vibrio nigripulchritudo TaxID=28173 RepID=UPI00056E59B3|nr:hypothetical protein [Vibrio nigripulchritudo]